jgi:hypothetical protein
MGQTAVRREQCYITPEMQTVESEVRLLLTEAAYLTESMTEKPTNSSDTTDRIHCARK